MNQPAMIEATTNAISLQHCTISDLQADLEFINDGFLFAVTRATDEATGKPLYPNEQLRNAALREQQRQSTQHQLAALNLRLAQERLAQLLAQQERIRNEFKEFLLDKQERILTLQ